MPGTSQELAEEVKAEAEPVLYLSPRFANALRGEVDPERSEGAGEGPGE